MKYVLLALLFGACSNTKNDLVEEPYTPACPQTAFFGTTDPPDPVDLQHAEWALAGCKRRGLECLISITKRGERDYRAVCGYKR